MPEALEQTLLVLAIFLARVADVSLGTVRTILVFRGHKALAAAIGFAESLIWVLAATQVLANLDTWYLAVAYASGFAAGNVVGITLEGKLALGAQMVRAVSTDATVDLGGRLRDSGFDVIELTGRGAGFPVEVLLVVVRRRRMRRLLETIDAIDPGAYYTISDVKESAEQVPQVRRWRDLLSMTSKRK